MFRLLAATYTPLFPASADAAGAQLTELVLVLTAVSIVIALAGKIMHIVLRASRAMDHLVGLVKLVEEVDEDLGDVTAFLERELDFVVRRRRRQPPHPA